MTFVLVCHLLISAFSSISCRLYSDVSSLSSISQTLSISSLMCIDCKVVFISSCHSRLRGVIVKPSHRVDNVLSRNLWLDGLRSLIWLINLFIARVPRVDLVQVILGNLIWGQGHSANVVETRIYHESSSRRLVVWLEFGRIVWLPII